MNDLEVYEEILEEEQLSVMRLKETFLHYELQITHLALNVLQTGYRGDELATEFFRYAEEAPLLSFESNERFILLKLMCIYKYDEKTKKSDFYVHYLLEERNLSTMKLVNATGYSLHQEEDIINTLKNLGYKE